MDQDKTNKRDVPEVPSEISVGVYFFIDDEGNMIFDEEEMQREFEEKLKKMKEQ